MKSNKELIMFWNYHPEGEENSPLFCIFSSYSSVPDKYILKNIYYNRLLWHVFIYLWHVNIENSIYTWKEDTYYSKK